MAVANMALESPLLNHNDIAGAKNILINITSGEEEITLEETYMITEYIQERAGNNADIIWGAGKDDSLGSDIEVTIIATGFDYNQMNMVSYSPLQGYKDSLRKSVPTEEPGMQAEQGEPSVEPEAREPEGPFKTRIHKPVAPAAQPSAPEAPRPVRTTRSETGRASGAKSFRRSGRSADDRFEARQGVRYRYRRAGEPSGFRAS